MNNSEMPAMPMVSPDREVVFFNEGDLGFIKQCNGAIGLTKREYFAGLIAQGLASDSQFAGDLEEMATCAVSWADALLKKLEEAK